MNVSCFQQLIHPSSIPKNPISQKRRAVNTLCPITTSIDLLENLVDRHNQTAELEKQLAIKKKQREVLRK
jgi:hypothetical protein